MNRSPLLVLFPIIAGILFAVGAIRFYMRADRTGMIINLIAAAVSFWVSRYYMRQEG